MKCNYNKNQSIPRYMVATDNENIIMVQISEEEYIKNYYEAYGIEDVTPKDKLVAALKNGDYVIGVDFNPLVLYSVYHYEDGEFDVFHFRDDCPFNPSPLKLERAITVLCPTSIDDIIDFLPNFDGFLVSKKENLLDLQNIPPTIPDDYIRK